MKKVLISVGPIPARLDSVKFLTNRFKGGLAIKTAKFLRDRGLDITIVAWRFTDIEDGFNVIRVDDVVDYYKKVLEFNADAYVLSAAVANLMPSSPYEGKFPSHKYKVGDRFNIEFEIAPRVIDEIKKKHPRSALIGYKLLDGSSEELIAAGKKTLFDSLANVVFANHPKWAKERKIVLTQDGAIFETSFDEHCDLIYKVIMENFYSTQIISKEVVLSDIEKLVVKNYPTYQLDGREYGTFAIKRDDGSFITTTRGKKAGREKVSQIFKVDHEKKIIQASEKATLNAPLLAKMFEINPEFKVLLHGHDLVGKKVHDKYEFAGTSGDLNFAKKVEAGEEILLNHHGYIVGFKNSEEFLKYIRKW